MDITKELSKLEQMKDDLYDINRTMSVINEALKAQKEETKLFLGEITECEGEELSVLILAKTEEEANEKLCKYADESYYEYTYQTRELELTEYGLIDMNSI